MGRAVGFEPTHIGTTIRGLNRLTTPAILFCLIIYYSFVTRKSNTYSCCFSQVK